MNQTQQNNGQTQKNKNVNPHEIAKFEALASRWWDPGSEFKPLHDINPLRLDYVDRAATLMGKKVLDIGCGGGILSESMAFRGAQVTGIDMGDTPLKVARLHAMESGAEVDYQLISAEDMAQQHAGEFDIVTCMEMLEHVPDPGSTIAACSALLKPGGRAFFSTINRNPKSYLFAIVGAEYVLSLLPKGTHDFKNFIRPSELEAWARAAGINLKDLTGMSYNPLSRHYSLGKDLSVNYLCYGIKEED
jgi:2-polyprenyl-6-hydroxyphenyl methylase/3-demethylubiquinone-9 3-methyltransferase